MSPSGHLPLDQSELSILSVTPATCDARASRRHFVATSSAASHLYFKQCGLLSAASILVAAAHLFTLQARSSSRRAASTRVPRHHFTRLLAVHHCAKLLLTNFPVWESCRRHLGRPPCLAIRALAQRTQLYPYPRTGLVLRLLSPTPSTIHRTLLLCCPCRADPTQPSNTFHMNACTRILPIHTAGRQRDPETSHQRACRSSYTDAPPLCVAVSNAASYPL
jgi:hypothetical protein